MAVVRFDVPGEPVNTLQADFATELDARLRQARARIANVKAVVLTSGKLDSFVAGADIKWLRAVERAEQASELSRTGPTQPRPRLVDFRVPVVAAIHGACLGGGLELPRSPAARVASTDEKTKLSACPRCN